MAEEIAFEKGRISNFEGLVTLTLTLDRVILHSIVHHSSTSTYDPNFIEIEKTFCGRTDVRTDGRTDGHLRPALLDRLWRVDLKRKVGLTSVKHKPAGGIAMPGGIIMSRKFIVALFETGQNDSMNADNSYTMTNKPLSSLTYTQWWHKKYGKYKVISSAATTRQIL